MGWFLFVYAMIPITLICALSKKENPISDRYVSGEISLLKAWWCLFLVIALWPLLLTVIIMRSGRDE